eukprot:SAG11_NODE_4697_length_1802_cov_1.265414_2_plen_207_part_00
MQRLERTRQLLVGEKGAKELLLMPEPWARPAAASQLWALFTSWVALHAAVPLNFALPVERLVEVLRRVSHKIQLSPAEQATAEREAELDTQGQKAAISAIDLQFARAEGDGVPPKRSGGLQRGAAGGRRGGGPNRWEVEDAVAVVVQRLSRKEYGGLAKANEKIQKGMAEALGRCKVDLAHFIMGVEVPNVAEPLQPSVFGDFPTS